MKKVKRWVILPVGLFASNYFLGFYRDPWRVFFMKIFLQKKFFFLCRSLLSCAAYIFLIAFLFLFVFTDYSLKDLFKKRTLKMLGIVYCTELVLRLVSIFLNKIMRSQFPPRASLHGAVQQNEWYMVSVILSWAVIHFTVIYLTLWLLTKSLNLEFTFRKGGFCGLIVLCIAVNSLNSYTMLWLGDYLVKTGSVTLTSVSVLGLTMSMDAFTILLLTGQDIFVMLLDFLIFEHVNRCVRNRSEPIPVENSNS